MQETVAIIVSVTALGGTLLSLWRLKSETRRWRTEYQEARQRWAIEQRAKQDEQHLRVFERTLERRIETYGPVLSLLGKVRDYDSPDRKYYRDLLKNRDQLSEVSDGLLEALYGEAGLVMEMQTRNALVAAYWAVEAFCTENGGISDVIRKFYVARRFLRSDLQIADDPSIKGTFEKRRDEFLEVLDSKLK